MEFAKGLCDNSRELLFIERRGFIQTANVKQKYRIQTTLDVNSNLNNEFPISCQRKNVNKNNVQTKLQNK